MTVLFDAGAFIALERGNRALRAVIAREQRAGRLIKSHGGVIGQVWRGGFGRQTIVARTIEAVDVVPLDVVLGQRAGALLARSRTPDVIDAALVCLAVDGDVVFTSDADDLAHLAEAAAIEITIVPTSQSS